MSRTSLALAVLGFWVTASLADDGAYHPKDPRVVDARLASLEEFRNVDTAVVTRLSRSEPSIAASQPGYLGVHVDATPPGQVTVVHVEPNSPAAVAGLRVDDVVLEAGGQRVPSPGVFGDILRSRTAGETLKLVVQREAGVRELTATLAATSRPLSASGQRATMGVQVGESREGVRIEQVLPNSPAAAAGIKVGDVLLKVNSSSLSAPDQLSTSLSDKQPGDTVRLLLQRDGKPLEVGLRLAGTSTGRDDGSQSRWDTRMMTLFKKDVYRLAVVLVEFPDVKHNARVSTWDWEQALFSTGVYNGKNATGQQVYGSLNDYYLEQSCGAFRVEGKVFDWVTVGKKRAEYASDTRREMLSDALDRLYARDGRNALKDYDGIFFVYAGDRVQTNRGGLFWPHRSTMVHGVRRWSYFICPEGGSRMYATSTIAHEFGHMLGLPDLYARPESPGSEGLGLWCTMSYGHGRDGKPLHFSAWCKEQMGWLKPAVIDPTVKQKLILAPIENSSRECFKVLVRPDGSEYLLLENRARNGYDRDLPAEGLLIWRIVDGRPALEESHGIQGPVGPERFLGSVPYPSGSNTAFTPYTTPSSRSQKGGGLPVHITNIQRLPDGRITFFIGYEYF